MASVKGGRRTTLTLQRLVVALGIGRAYGVYPARKTFFDTQSNLQRAVDTQNTDRLYLPVHDGLSLVDKANQKYSAAMLTETQAKSFLDDPATITAALGRPAPGSPLEGRVGADTSFWMLDVSHLPEPPAQEAASAEWKVIRAGAGGYEVLENLKDDDEAALLSTARGLGLWHRSVKRCAACGSPTESRRDGRLRQCTNESCGERFRPRQDTSIIVLVTDGADRCLLGRNARWPEGRYSTLSGFLEFGETLEECVVREVLEESGVRVKRESLRFVASQPWLFPRSLMVGFLAEAADSADTSLAVDEDELADAAWFERDFIAERVHRNGPVSAKDTFHVPTRVSLANTLITQWLDEGAGSS